MSTGPNYPEQPLPHVTPQVVYEGRTPRAQRSVFSVLLWLGLAMVAMCGVVLFCAVLVGGAVAAISGVEPEDVEERYHSLSKTATDKVAILSVEGMIVENEGFVKRQIDHILKDETVKAVVLRVDSPGGSVSASDYLYHHLKKMVEEREIPMVVSMGSLAASGGYYVAMAVGDQKDAIFVEPTTWTGSIGVIIPHYDLVGLMDKLAVADDSIMSGPLKDIGSPTKKMTDEERAILQGLVDDAFVRFKEIVRAGRPEFEANPEALDRLATGQVFTAKQAVDDGLADREGFVEEAIDRAIELAALDRDDTRVVKYRDRLGGILGLLSGSSANARPSVNAHNAAELLSPRAYYLYTVMPYLLQSAR